MPSFLSSLLERLALSHLTRNGNKACVLLPEDNVLIVRNGHFIPVFASQDSDHARLGAVYLNALWRIAHDPAGELDFRTAVDVALEQSGTPLEVRVKFKTIFDEAHSAKVSAQ